MGYKKHNWLQYGRQGEVIEISIKGGDGHKIDFFRCDNNKDYKKILKIINSKYGFDFNPEIGMKDSINKEKNAWMDEDFA